MMKKLSLMMLTILSGFFIISNAYAAAAVDCTDVATCDQETFTSVAPDALIVLDLSDNMNKNPAGGSNIYGKTIECLANTTACGTSADAIQNGFSATSITGCATPCSRLAIAKRAIFDVLDDDNNDVINNSDANSLGIRFGFMRFQNGEYASTDITPNPPNYNNGSIKLIKPIATSYQNIYCGAAATNGSCASSATTCVSGTECIANETALGGAALAGALIEAKQYLVDNQTADSAAGDCRQKFAILITASSDDCYNEGDGSAEPTSQCIGECANGSNGSASRRSQTVLQAKALYDAGYMVYAVGFGASMPDYLKNTLNWVARYGGTDNPTEVNSGIPDAYNPANNPSNSREITGVCGGNPISWHEKTNDPGYGVAPPVAGATSYPLSGYAFIAENAVDLIYSLKAALSAIRDQTYSFTRVSVQTVRTVDENYIYEASFAPLLETTDKDPFWIGHLKRYSLNNDGSLHVSADWDAGEILKARTTARTIYTYKTGSSTVTVFNTANITMTDLGTATEAKADAIVDFIHNGDTLYATGDARLNWKLGDIFHSSPISIGTPSAFFTDKVDESSPKAYETYRTAAENQRTSANGKRLIVAGANDGQFHVFKTGEQADGGGSELWSFIPPNLLSRLKNIYHESHLSSQPHQYFVDGPTTASDVWTGTGAGTAKTADQWKAYMIISEGRGGSSTLWCSSASCDSGCSDTYSATRNQYCGYYAFDVTNTTATTPTYLWHFGGTSGLTATQGDHLGQPWSKITIGRVKISGNERWVGFAAGGYAGTDCKGGGGCDKKGKGFYVIDILNGSILWTFTHSGPDGEVNANMDYSLAGQPAAVDLDEDGFVDTVYAADLGGNVWRFKMCTKAEMDASSCTSESNWTGGLFFETASGNIRPIYTKPTVIHTTRSGVWVYFGTGDVNDPTASNAQENMYAVKDNPPRTATYHLNNLQNITSGTFDPNSTTCINNPTQCIGWFMNLTGSGQKILSDPTVYADVVYFTSYNPSSSSDVCATGGDASLNAVDYITGAGMFDTGTTDSQGNKIMTRSTDAGTGIASGAVLSENPYGGTNIYVTTSEGAKINPVQPPDPYANKANLQYWHDMRVQ